MDFDISMKDTKTEHSIGGGVMTARLMGLLHVPDSWKNVTEMLKMCTSFSSTILRLSRNHLPSELVNIMLAMLNTASDSLLIFILFYLTGSGRKRID